MIGADLCCDHFNTFGLLSDLSLQDLPLLRLDHRLLASPSTLFDESALSAFAVLQPLMTRIPSN